VCNYNPVIFLKYPANYVFSGLGIPEESGALSGRLSDESLSGSCYPGVVSLIERIDAYYATKFAKLVAMLDGVTNPDGSTLLDHSAAVWFQEMSDGCARNLNNLPILQAGSCGGYFKTGWTINVDPANPSSPTLTQGNSTIDCTDGTSDQMANALTQETGTPAAIASAPINKYYCNLMNALGMTGDSTGFPSAGGTRQVMRFGYSDLTTDFCGGLGAVAGAGVHDPGEFLDFRA
jgi:hypothetical protein